MVRKNELKRVNDITIHWSAFIQKKIAEYGYNIMDVSQWLNKAYSYAYIRIKGDKSPTLDEIDTIVRHVGYSNIFDFINDLYEYTYPSVKQAEQQSDMNRHDKTADSPHIDPWMLVANEDENKEAEREEYYD